MSSPASARRRLSRSRTDRVVAGVAGGLAQHLDLDVTAVRFGFVAASLLLLGGIGGPLLYLAAWALVPEEGKESSIASDTFQAKPWEAWGASAQGTTGPTL
jgi:phage shock protein PspC (stress-responsive transcriptional regulator)